MARPLRIEYEGACYHIISRGNDEQAIFIDDNDHRKFLAIIEELYDKYKFNIYAYVFMKNHYHLFIETPLGKISSIMKELNGNYAGYFNYKYNKVGHLFQGRYKSILVDKESYLLELTRYIHLNPVRAKVIDIPEKYEWSSLKYYIADNNIKWLNKDLVLNYFGSHREKASNLYLKFVYSRINKEDDLFKNLYAQSILGKERFVKYIKDRFINKDEVSEETTSYRELRSSIDIETMAEIITNYFSIKPEDLKSFRSENSLARNFFVLLVKKYTSAKNIEIKNFLGQISNSGVSLIKTRFLEKVRKTEKLYMQLRELENKIGVRY